MRASGDRRRGVGREQREPHHGVQPPFPESAADREGAAVGAATRADHRRRRMRYGAMRSSRSIAATLVLAAAFAVAGAAASSADAEAVHEHIDHRHGHERAYADHGVVVAAVPHDAIVVRDGANRYWFHGGVWYRPEAGHYVVIAPPLGVFVPVLP